MARIAIFFTALAAISHRAATPCAAQEISDKQVRASGETVYRWNIGDAQASLFEGNCTVEHDGKSATAQSVLIVSDGPPGRVRIRAVIDKGRSNANQKPNVVTFLTADEPRLNSRGYRGAPKETPDLLRYLPDLNPQNSLASNAPADAKSSGMVAPAFQATPSPRGTNPGGIAPGNGPSNVAQVQFESTAPLEGETLQYAIPLEPPALSMPNLQAPIRSGGSIQNSFAPPILSAPNSGLMIDTPPNSPTTFADGATTGGWLFTVGGGTRSVEILARSASMPPQITATNRPESNETIVVARGGVTVLVRDVTAQAPDGRMMDLGTISLSADRIVAWMPTFADILRNNEQLSQSDGELYLEGDIVFRQGNQIIYAESMYYNVSQEKGVVLDAEAIITVPEYEGVVRLKADVMQQIASGDFVAFDAALTSSRLGVPRYWLQSQQLRLNQRSRTIVDPITRQSSVKRESFVSSNDNFVYFGGVPIMYWPRFAAKLEIPTFYLTDAKIQSDSAFGDQVLLDFNVFQLLGMEGAPDGLEWELSTDYFSDRGPAIGTNFQYRTPGFLGVAGPTNGFFDAWIIDDKGKDRLGLDRLALEPEKQTRGRALWRHRQYLKNDFEMIAELGWLSDRNFLEQYLENEWDQEKDHETAVRLRKYLGNNLIDLSAQLQVNDFYTETEQLPSLDHYLIGGSLGNLINWNMHNRVAYAKLNVADDPTNAAEAAEYSALPGETAAKGVIASTQHEISMPLPVGPINIVPFLSGEASHYGEAADGESLTRLLGQTGIRASLMMSKIDPTIQSSLLNVRGLAHKMEWTAEYFYADSDTDLDELPYYDPLDDNAQEQFRRRFIGDTFMAAALPSRFDPRTYAFRHGLQRNVTNPSDVIADDLQQMRLGNHQRWQTKRGLPGRERIVDLMRFDTDLILFPDADRDNFGETIGPALYDFQYHLGDRFSLLSDGYFDFFNDGLRSISAGVRASRPGMGDWYVGLLSLEGPISSTVLRTSMDYRVNEKWILSGATAYDFGEAGNIGQSLGITRIGESLLVQMALNIDTGRDNVGVGFSVEPRFWPGKKLGRLGGQLIRPPGVEGLE
ncbi:LPS-assembly protein LptD [Planctomycetes bacterium K23_9]|uniref:LPS-assembly protein LptD n=1 Tax=Stieleria marina TaxID=1930275 RepID=UPI0011A4BB65